MLVNMMALSWEENPPGTVPRSTETWARLLGEDRRKVSRMLEGKLGTLWAEKDGRLVNKKMFEIGQEFENTHERLSAAGKKGNDIRWGKSSPGDRNLDLDTDTDRDLKGSASPRGDGQAIRNAAPASGPGQKAPPASLEECKPWQSREAAHFLEKLPEKERKERFVSLQALGFEVEYIKAIIGLKKGDTG